jgi:hypothetical protein
VQVRALLPSCDVPVDQDDGSFSGRLAGTGVVRAAPKAQALMKSPHVADSGQARKIHQQLLLGLLQNAAITGCVLIMTVVAALADITKAMAAKAMSLFIVVPCRN